MILDIDNTLCPAKKSGESYADLMPYADMIELVREYKAKGFYVILYSARNMRTHDGNVGRINADTLKTLLAWLERHDIPHDEIHVGKPWPGKDGFYVDDRTVRPSEFRSMTHEQILDLLAREDRDPS
ncbi:MAG: capsular biosynthesis protein [Hyphomonas sp.]|nr:capsular biosynthesis protein [Hyphomonas sp.]